MNAEQLLLRQKPAVGTVVKNGLKKDLHLKGDIVFREVLVLKQPLSVLRAGFRRMLTLISDPLTFICMSPKSLFISSLKNEQRSSFKHILRSAQHFPPPSPPMKSLNKSLLIKPHI